MELKGVYSEWNDTGIARRFRTAVSLHSHTQHSKESLDFLPRLVRKIPLASNLFSQIDFSNGWWTPPLCARQAYDLERRQIEQELGLQAMVSLTDHDDIAAPMSLHVLPEMREMPISVEWTVPFEETYFHVGVHNMPFPWAALIMERLASYTSAPRNASLSEMFSILQGLPNVLVILNHPLWDEMKLGRRRHIDRLLQFLRKYREWIHGLELNGLRPGQENAEVIELSRDWSFPLISGGDRHGLEPNAIVNLTNATTFAEFVSEIRNDLHSEVLFLKQYRKPHHLRVAQTVIDVLSDYENFPENRRRWTDRIFFQLPDAAIQSLSEMRLDEGPMIVKLVVQATRLVESGAMRNILRMAFAGKQEVSVG